MSEPLSPPHRGITVALTTVAYLMVTLDALVVITALPAIHEDLGGDVASLQWTVNAYTLAFASGIVTASALGDRLGRRRVYTAGLALFTLASVACALAPGLGSLIAFRAVAGPRSRRHHAARHDVADVGVPARAARPGRWPLGRRRRARGRRRPACRRQHHRGSRLALDVLGQRPDRHRRHRRCTAGAA